MMNLINYGIEVCSILIIKIIRNLIPAYIRLLACIKCFCRFYSVGPVPTMPAFTRRSQCIPSARVFRNSARRLLATAPL